MRDYIRTNYISASQVDNYLSQGWEIIETTKSFFPPEDTQITYHVGLPARTLLEKYRNIIRDYEKFDLDKTLFEKIAESHGKNIADYEISGWGDDDEVSQYLTNYERIINNSNKSYVLKRQDKDEMLF